MKPCRAIGMLLVVCLLWSGAAIAGQAGREVLRNGATLSWQIADTADRNLGLAVPAFAQWGPKSFADPVTIRMTASALASVDAWQLSFHRAGDTRFERPLRRFRGAALTLSDPLIWDGSVEDGPPLRPGETVLAVLEVRDSAGNIDRAVPQEMLVARYVMKRERRRIDALDAERAARVGNGSPPKPASIPSRGRTVSLRIDDWPEEDDPMVSGLPLRRDGAFWVLEQTLPGGPYEFVVQIARPIIGGIRAIPVGIVRLVVPSGAPLLASVKGTGALDRHERLGPVPRGLRADGAIEGADAARLVMLDRRVGEDRLALALVDPAQTVDLAKDRRKRRSVVLPLDPATALWAGKGAPSAPIRAPDKGRTRKISIRIAGATNGEIVLPHTDIVRGSLSIEPENGSRPLSPVRDFFANPAQGRVLLTENAIARLGDQGGVLRLRYEVPSFAPRLSGADGVVESVARYGTTWGTDGLHLYDTSLDRKVEKGAVRKILDWLVGAE